MTESYPRMLLCVLPRRVKCVSLREMGGIKVVSVLEFGFRRGWEEQVSLCLGLRWIVNLFSSQNSIELFNLRSTAWDKVVVRLDLESTGSLGYSR